jgi:hypothetical protein
MAEQETKTVELYNPHDSLTGRDGGPYLDQVEAVEAERRRALVEDREPDLDNPPATAGIPLVTGGQLIAMSTSSNIPSQENTVNPISDALAGLAEKSDFPVNVHSTVEVTDLSKAPAYDAANPTTVSTGNVNDGDTPDTEGGESEQADDSSDVDPNAVSSQEIASSGTPQSTETGNIWGGEIPDAPETHQE